MNKITIDLSLVKMNKSQQQPIFKFGFDLEILLIKSNRQKSILKMSYEGTKDIFARCLLDA